MNTVKMLALREWMQHGRAWLLLAAVPLVVALLAVGVGQVSLDEGDGVPALTVAAVYYLASGGYLAGLGAFAALVAGIQAPGLARRDVQDRSIEFWLSLPVDHWRAVLVPMVMLMVVMPLVVMAISLLATPLLGSILALRLFGSAGLAQMDWGSYLGAWAVLGLRMTLGILVGALWLAPLVAVSMAVSAWFKRWGVVVFLAVVFVGALLLDKAYGLHGPMRALGEVMTRAIEGYSIIGGENTMPHPERMGQGVGFAAVSHALLLNIRALLAGMVTLSFLAGLAVAGLGVWAQVLRRSRG